MAELTARREIITQAEINLTFEIGKSLLPQSGSQYASRMRLSSIKFVDGKYHVVWSKAFGSYSALVEGNLSSLKILKLGEFGSVILAAAQVDYVPVFDAGLGAITLEHQSYRRPRFVELINLG